MTPPKGRTVKRNGAPILECSECRTPYAIKLALFVMQGTTEYTFRKDCKCKSPTAEPVVRETNGHAEYARLPFPTSRVDVTK